MEKKDYIERSAAIQVVCDNPHNIAIKTVRSVTAIKALPAADVAPKSEVARELLEELEAELAEAKCFDNECAVYLRLTIKQLKMKYIKESEL